MMAYDVRYSPNRWRDDPEDIKPGFGGIWPGDPDAKTHQVRLAATSCSNRFLEESKGLGWVSGSDRFAMCNAMCNADVEIFWSIEGEIFGAEIFSVIDQDWHATHVPFSNLSSNR